MSPTYRLSDEDWKMFEDNGFIAFPVWGGIVWSKVGYRDVFCASDEPEVRFISGEEIDERVNLLAGGNNE